MKFEPLANKIRPKSISECVGQEHLIGEGMPLRIAIEQKKLFSFILFGPCGVGKTTISRIYAQSITKKLKGKKNKKDVSFREELIKMWHKNTKVIR